MQLTRLNIIKLDFKGAVNKATCSVCNESVELEISDDFKPYDIISSDGKTRIKVKTNKQKLKLFTEQHLGKHLRK